MLQIEENKHTLVLINMLLSPSGMEESGDSDQSSRSPQGFPASLQLHPSPTLARQVSDEM